MTADGDGVGRSRWKACVREGLDGRDVERERDGRAEDFAERKESGGVWALQIRDASAGGKRRSVLGEGNGEIPVDVVPKNQDSRRRGKQKFREEEQEFRLAQKGELIGNVRGGASGIEGETVGRGNGNGREKVLRKGEREMDLPMYAGGW